MPPKKRKAPPRLQAVPELTEQEPEALGDISNHNDIEALQSKLEETDERVSEAAAQLWNAALKDAERIRSSFKITLMSIPPKVRNMSCAEFFGLSEAEAQLDHIKGMHARLAAMESQSEAPAAGRRRGAKAVAAPSSPLAQESLPPQPAAAASNPHEDVEACTAAPPTCMATTRVTRRAASRLGLTLDTAGLPPTAMTVRRTRAATKQDTQPPQQQSIQPPAEAAPAAVVSKRPPRGSRAVKPAAAGSVPAAEELGAPAAAGHKEPLQEIDTNAVAPAASPEPGLNRADVAATPMCHAGLPGSACVATGMMTVAATGVRGSRAADAAQHQVLGGMTLIRRPAVKGRTVASRRGAGGEKPEDEHAMVFKTADGQEVMVDAAKGLASVPQQYRPDIQRQLEQLQRLASAALSKG